jgi:hypothetical protein
MRTTPRHASLVALSAAFGLVAAVAACGNSSSDSLAGETFAGNPDPATQNGSASNPGSGGTPPGTQPGASGADPQAASNPNIDKRKVNYGEALRTASLKLVGELPALADVALMADSSNAATKAAYESKIDALLSDPRFTARQIQWWRDTLKTGQQGAPKNGMPSFDTAATFAAEVVVTDRPYTDLFTASTNTCPTYAAGKFTDASCGGTGPTAGLLTDPGIMSQYYANMAFRRVRFVQETFVCSKFPAEFTTTPTPMGGGVYTSPWNFNSISGGNAQTVRVNFQDTSSVVCANCHTSMNHAAPLFANFDEKGAYQKDIQVKVPSTGTPTAKLEDWLPGGESFAWRNGTTVTDLASYGKAIAADADVARCIVTREWNFAMSRADVVNDLATVPPVVTDSLVADFTANGFKLKRLIRNIFTADDFVKF